MTTGLQIHRYPYITNCFFLCCGSRLTWSLTLLFVFNLQFVFFFFEKDIVSDITNFSYVSYPHSINTSWAGCGNSYTVNLTKAVYDRKEIPHIRWLNESSMYKFERLEECTAYNVSIKSDDGNVYKATIRTCRLNACCPL